LNIIAPVFEVSKCISVECRNINVQKPRFLMTEFKRRKA
jgi:hypothetical protein